MKPELEIVELDSGHSIKSLHFKCASFQDDHSWHFHPECEVSYIVKGSGTLFIGDCVESFQAGDLIFVGTNIPHCWASDNTQLENEMSVVQFNPLCLGQGFLETPEANEINKLFTQASRGIKFTGESVNKIKASIQAIAISKGLFKLSAFINLLAQLCQAKETRLLATELYLADNTEFHGERLKKVMKYLNDNLANDIKQTEIADIVNMTPQSFSRFFKATTGRTFVAFVNILRITQASKQLINNDHDIIEIAFDCGYNNISNFNRQFSEIKQCTPSEYRKKHRLIIEKSV